MLLVIIPKPRIAIYTATGNLSPKVVTSKAIEISQKDILGRESVIKTQSNTSIHFLF